MGILGSESTPLILMLISQSTNKVWINVDYVAITYVPGMSCSGLVIWEQKSTAIAGSETSLESLTVGTFKFCKSTLGSSF